MSLQLNTKETIIKMMETLPERVQDRILDDIKHIIAEALDDLEWDGQFEKHRKGLVTMARKVKKQMAKGMAEPMDYARL